MGRYPSLLALPDRWISWLMGAVPLGLHLVRKYRPDVIWSTYPIATAHLIGLSLRRITGLPWVADLRDPMTDVDYPLEPFTRRIYEWIEKRTINDCTRAVLTTPGAINDYKRRFPRIPASRFYPIENGYDEENFTAAEAHIGGGLSKSGEQFVLVHSGIIYPSERDPVAFFEALAALLERRLISPLNLKVILRATAHDEYLLPLISRYGLGLIVSLAPAIPYQDALAEMLSADGLLILQASNCNNQIPAKLYEYLRARRPILALTDPAGNTAAALRDAGIDTIARLDSKNDIMLELLRFLTLTKENKAPIAPHEKVIECARRSRTEQLSNLLSQIAPQNT
jgi:glycosyltransferase involved in cell wall biosynthesis